MVICSTGFFNRKEIVMKIQVLGTGCSKCKTLTENVKAAVVELRIDAQVEKVEDIRKIMEFGVMSTPALVVDGEVKSVGKVPTMSEIKDMLR